MRLASVAVTWEKQVLSARGVQKGRKALRVLHIYSMEMHRQRPRAFK
jgi:hypothetical protein